jgi:hypothetical protein
MTQENTEPSIVSNQKKLYFGEKSKKYDKFIKNSETFTINVMKNGDYAFGL